MKDLRTPIALARDQWLESDEGKRCSEGTTSGKGLENRLMCAFVAGWNAREKQEKAEREFDVACPPERKANAS
jgi:hypothetical protein